MILNKLQEENELNLTEENDSLLFLEQESPEPGAGSILPGMASFSNAY